MRRVPFLVPCLAVAIVIFSVVRAQPDRSDRAAPVIRATLRGKVRFTGPKPDLAALDKALEEEIDRSRDGDYVRKGGKEATAQQTWKIDEKGGLANVFVWLNPPDGCCFKIDQQVLDHKTWPDEVVIDQPFCTFTPHAVVLFPSYYSGKATGQKVKFRNSARVAQAVGWGSSRVNPGSSWVLLQGQELEAAFQPDDEVIQLRDSIHPWEVAYLQAFDHPFAAVSGPDGSFEIKNAPAGVELTVVAWHEAAGYLTPRKGEKVKLSSGENVKDFTARQKKSEPNPKSFDKDKGAGPERK
jgi:hypothetical protein